MEMDIEEAAQIEDMIREEIAKLVRIGIYEQLSSREIAQEILEFLSGIGYESAPENTGIRKRINDNSLEGRLTEAEGNQ